MQFTIDEQSSDLAKLKQVIVFTFSLDEFNKALNQQFQAFAKDKSFKLAGFRPGALPLDVVKRYRSEEAQTNVLNQFREQAVREFAQQTERTIAAVTDIQVTINKESSDSFVTMRLTLEYNPEIKVVDLKDIKVVKPVIDLNDTVEQMLLALRVQRIVYVDTDKPATTDYRVLFKAEAFDEDGNPVAAYTTDSLSVKIGDPEADAEIATAFIGRKAGDSFELELARVLEEGGPTKHIEVNFTVLQVQEAIIPDIDDNFCEIFLQRKSNINDLKAEIRKNIQREVKIQTTRYLSPQIHDALLSKYQNVVLPFNAVQAIAQQNRFNDIRSEARELGQSEREVAAKYPDTLQPQELKLAANRLLFDVILREYRDWLKITVSQEDVDNFIEELAVMYEYPEDFGNEVKRDKNLLNHYVEEIFTEKLIEALLELCTVEEKPMNYTDLIREVNAQSSRVLKDRQAHTELVKSAKA